MGSRIIAFYRHRHHGTIVRAQNTYVVGTMNEFQFLVDDIAAILLAPQCFLM
jgi:hypothetical protein